MEYKDYYKTLGVERSAGQDEIKRAYRRLARKYHPDVSAEADAGDRFKEVSEAYEVLRDPEKRKAYDQFGSDWKAGQDYQPPPGGQQWTGGFGAGGGFEGSGDFSDFFESVFGAGQGMGGGPGGGMGAGMGGRRAYNQAQMKGEDIDASISIPIEDAFTGATRSLTLRVPELDGQGRLVNRRKTLNVKIPKGVRANQRIRLEGQGGPGFGGAPAGDLFLRIEFEPHKLYRADGSDLSLDLPVTPWEAALGRTVKVPTPGGTVDMKLPAGARSGQRLRLKGRGLPSKTPGDLYAVIQLQTPRADNDALRSLYEQLERESGFNPRSTLGA